MLSKHAKNALSNAQTIRLAGGNRTLHRTITAADPTDYYKFRVTQRSSLTAIFSGLTSTVDVTLFNQQGGIINQSAHHEASQTSLKRGLNSGLYFIKVARNTRNTSYTLRLALHSPAPTPKSAKSNPFIRQVLNLTNAQRTRAGLKPLKLNSKLNKAALAHSKDMAINDFFSHVSSNGSSVFDRITAANYTYATAAENIAAGYATPAAVVAAWMNSPGHRANILSPLVRELGVGFYFLKDDPGKAAFHSYWTQDFGTSF